MAKATKDKAAESVVDPVETAPPVVATQTADMPAPPTVTAEVQPVADASVAVGPELKEFDCDMPVEGRPPAISMARTVKAKDAYDAVDVYFKTLGIIETPYRPIIREKVAGK